MAKKYKESTVKTGAYWTIMRMLYGFEKLFDDEVMGKSIDWVEVSEILKHDLRQAKHFKELHPKEWERLQKLRALSETLRENETEFIKEAESLFDDILELHEKDKGDSIELSNEDLA